MVPGLCMGMGMGGWCARLLLPASTVTGAFAFHPGPPLSWAHGTLPALLRSGHSCATPVDGVVASSTPCVARCRAPPRPGLVLGAEAGVQEASSIALPPISVFDGVFAPGATTEALGDYGPGIYRRWVQAGIDAGKALFYQDEERDDSDSEATNTLSPVEEFIESLLVAVDDTADEVEYWAREDWLRVDAHRDTDEPSAVAGVRRFPSRVYIVYLDIAPDLIAPTVVWTPSSPQKKHEEEAGGRLTVVPAVAGRVLSFDGALLHGVPRPACQYLGATDSEAGKTKLRHVLIINSWTDFAPEDDEEDDYDDEDEYDEEDENSHEMLNGDEEEEKEETESVRMRPGCKPRTLWRDVPLRAQEEEEGVEEATCTFSMKVFGADDAFSTTVGAAALDVESMLTQTDAPSWLRTVVTGTGDVSDLQIGVPSEAGTRVERSDD